MDSIALLTASTADRPLFPGDPATAILSHITPAFTQLFRVQQLLRQMTIFMSLHAYVLASTTLHISKLVAINGYSATKFSAAISASLAVGTWESKAVRLMRKRMFHELATFILGCGNPIFCMVFWPGWWLVGGTTYAIWSLVG